MGSDQHFGRGSFPGVLGGLPRFQRSTASWWPDRAAEDPLNFVHEALAAERPSRCCEGSYLRELLLRQAVLEHRSELGATLRGVRSECNEPAMLRDQRIGNAMSVVSVARPWVGAWIVDHACAYRLGVDIEAGGLPAAPAARRALRVDLAPQRRPRQPRAVLLRLLQADAEILPHPVHGEAEAGELDPVHLLPAVLHLPGLRRALGDHREHPVHVEAGALSGGYALGNAPHHPRPSHIGPP